MQANVSQRSPLPWPASKFGAKHPALIFPSCCPRLSCLAPGRACFPCLPGSLHSCKMLSHRPSSAGSCGHKEENKLISILKAPRQQKIPRREGALSPPLPSPSFPSLDQA